MRQVAKLALENYKLSDTRFKFLRAAGNTLFQVIDNNPIPTPDTDIYETGKYLLRIHQPGYQTPEAIKLELEWLNSMVKDDNLPVPKPVFTLDGQLTTSVSIPGIPGQRTCSLLSWIRGRELKKYNIKPYHYEQLGKLIAQLHNHTEIYGPPENQSKRIYDWEGLFGKSTKKAWELLSPEYIKPFRTITKKVKRVMNDWGKSTEVYGLIHGDIGMEANVLFWKGNPRIIDFDDSGFGYYVFDLSIVLEDSEEDQIKSVFREALIDGYNQIRSLTEDQINALDLFLAAYSVYWSLYAVNAVQNHPEHKDYVFNRMARYLRLVKHYLKRN